MPLDSSPDADDTKKAGMDERELLAILRAEEVDATSYYTSELAKDQAAALDRYYAKPYGDEVEGRSRITTHDIEDTINWMMPDLMRLFFQSDDLITVASKSKADDEGMQDVADILAHYFFDVNDGLTILHDFAFDGLLQRMGVVSARWDDPKPEPPEVLKGVSAVQLQQYLDDPEYEILSYNEAGVDETASAVAPQPQTQAPSPQMQAPGAPGAVAPMAPQGMPVAPQPMPLFDIEVQRTPKCGKPLIENVAPEEFAISRRAPSIHAAPYHRREQEMYLADVVAMFPDRAADLDPDYTTSTAKDIEINSDPRTLARFQQESISSNRETSNHEKRKKVRLYTEYLWIDFDDDGVIELRQIKRVADTILENIRVKKSEFRAWSPIRVAHKLVGRSVADTIVDIQKLRTVVTRRTIDSLDQALVPRIAYNKDAMDPEDIDALIDAEVGGVIGTKGNPNEIMTPIVTPDLTAAGFQMLEYWDQKSEQASGVTRHAQGIAPDAITKTASGIDMLQAAANDRIELVARWLAKGVEEIVQSLLDLLCQYQDRPTTVKIKGRPVTFDPRRWADDMAVKVHIAMGAANRQTMLANLAMISAKQEQILMEAGPDNPLVSLKEYGHTLSRMVEIMGFKNTTKFFKDLSKGDLPPMPPKEDPKMAEVKGKLQLEQMKAQADGQMRQADMQQQHQFTAAEMQMKQQAAAQELELSMRKTEAELAAKERQTQLEAQIKMQQQQAEAELAVRQQNFEFELAQRKFEFESKLAQDQAAHSKRLAEQAHSVKMKQSKPDANGSSVRFGGEVG